MNPTRGARLLHHLETADRGASIIPAFGGARRGCILDQQARGGEAHPILPLVDSRWTPVAPGYIGQGDELVRNCRPTRLDEARCGNRNCVVSAGKLTVTVIRTGSRAFRSERPAIVISPAAWHGRRVRTSRESPADERNTVVVCGIQGSGKREGCCATAPVHRTLMARRAVAARIEGSLMSPHADAGEIMRWLGASRPPPARTCLVHGDLTPWIPARPDRA